jgi:cobyrinic acid a,c-diamide synthase
VSSVGRDPEAAPAAERARPVVAVAGGPVLLEPSRELRDALTALGAAVAIVDLAADDALPDGTAALVLGDGAPVPFAEALAANAGLREAIVALHRSGAPIVAEGAGVAVLASSLDGHPMCDLLAAAALPGPGGVPGTVELVAASDGPLHDAGERRFGRPSAAIALDAGAGAAPAWTVGRRPEGWAAPGLHASLVVVGWTLERARRLLTAAGVAR